MPQLHSLKLKNLLFSYRNRFEFWYLYTEIFLLGEYAFKTSAKEPVIFDCGAHTGLSILYFKQRYPNAKITAFEPHPGNIEVLKKNIEQNQIDGVEVVPAAVGAKEGEISLFFAEGDQPSWGNSTKANGTTANFKEEKVPVTRLSNYLKNQSVDFLKMDIEGAEFEVIHDIKPYLKNIQQFVIELHIPPAGYNTQLEETRNIFVEAGFTISVTKPFRILWGEFVDRLFSKHHSKIFIIHGKR